VAALLLAACQSSMAPGLRIGGQTADLILILVVLVGLFRGPTEGVWAGWAGALFWGALAGLPLGGLFVGYMGCGLAVGLLGQQVFSDRLPILVVVVCVAVLGVQLVGLIFTPPPSLMPWLRAVALQALLSGAATIPLAWIGRPLLRRPLSPLSTSPVGSVLPRRE
jgi:hypothetical protein